MKIQGAIILQEIIDDKVFQIILPAGAEWSQACKFGDLGFKQILAMAKQADEANKQSLEAQDQGSDIAEEPKSE